MIPEPPLPEKSKRASTFKEAFYSHPALNQNVLFSKKCAVVKGHLKFFDQAVQELGGIIGCEETADTPQLSFLHEIIWVPSFFFSYIFNNHCFRQNHLTIAMHIKGLLGLLKPKEIELHISEFCGRTLALDTSCLLYKEGYGSTEKLCLCVPTTPRQSDLFVKTFQYAWKQNLMHPLYGLRSGVLDSR